MLGFIRNVVHLRCQLVKSKHQIRGRFIFYQSKTFQYFFSIVQLMWLILEDYKCANYIQIERKIIFCSFDAKCSSLYLAYTSNLEIKIF